MTDPRTQATPGAGTPEAKKAARNSSVLDLRMILRHIGAAEDMQKRAIQDVILMATANYWDRRAQTFELARPRPGEFVGQASEDDVRTQDERLANLAEMCRFHARLMREACHD